MVAAESDAGPRRPVFRDGRPEGWLSAQEATGPRLDIVLHAAHLRLCLTCGHVGCCDSSPGCHARLHAHRIGHPIVQSFEPGEDWRWCFFDETYV